MLLDCICFFIFLTFLVKFSLWNSGKPSFLFLFLNKQDTGDNGFLPQEGPTGSDSVSLSVTHNLPTESSS